MQSARRRLLAPLILFALTIGVHWKILLTKQYAPWDSPDLTYQVAPWYQEQAAELHQHHWPLLWDPFIMGGHPLLGQAQPGVVFPLNWLLFAIPLHHGFIRDVAINWYVALIRYIAALAMYALARDLGRSRIASIFAGAAFAFAGYIGLTTWPQMLNGGILAPLVILFTLRALRNDKPLWSAMLSGAWLGLSWLSGHHQIPIFVTLAVSGIWIYAIVRPQPRRSRFQHAGLFAVLVIVMIMGSAAQTLPAYSYGEDVLRWVGASDAVGWKDVVPYSVHNSFSLEPQSALGIFIEGIYTGSNPFVGITILSMALMGIAIGWRHAAVKILGCVALGGLLFSYAGNTIFEGLIYSLVPMVEKARNPAMAIFIFHLGICALSAFGVDAVLNAQAAPARWLRRAAIACGAVAGLLWLHLIVVYGLKAPAGVRTAPVALTALAATMIAGILVALRSSIVAGAAGAALAGSDRRAMPGADLDEASALAGPTLAPRTAAILLTCVMMLEIGAMPFRDLRNRDQKWEYWPLLTRDASIAGYLKNRPAPFRVDVNSDDVPYNFGEWYGLDAYWGYLASAPVSMMRVQNEPRSRSLFGVRYYVAKKPDRGATRELYSDDRTGIKVFEIPGAMPRARVVHEVTRVDNPDLVNATLTKPEFNLEYAAFLLKTQPPALENCAGDTARVTHEEPELITIDANMQCRGMLIASEAFSKDWVATVDGRRVPLYAAYTVIDGVVLDRGAHHVELRYRPVSFYLGASLTIASWLIIAVFFIRRRRQPS